jgi:hypothetical protein
MSNRQMGALNARFKGDKWSDGEVIQLRDLCKADTIFRRLQK